MMSIYEIYQSKEKAVYPKSDFVNMCLAVLQQEEETNKEWIEVGEKAPTREVMFNILTRRTAFANPLWKKSLMKALGYRSINELTGEHYD